MLQVAVRGESMPLLLFSCGIEPDEVAGYVLQLAFGPFFQLVPCPGAEFVDFRGHTLLATVFGKLVQRVYGYEDYVVVGIYELYHLLCASVDICA